MADEKITDLSDGGVLLPDDEFVIARAGSNYKIAGSRIGVPLSITQYAPGTRVTKTLNTSALTALDTTNLTTASFTVPASGKVLVQATVSYDTGSSATQSVILALLNHTGGAQLGNSYVLEQGNSSRNAAVTTAYWYLTGLTPGASLQLDLAAYCAGTAHIYIVGFTGTSSSEFAAPATIVVWPA